MPGAVTAHTTSQKGGQTIWRVWGGRKKTEVQKEVERDGFKGGFKGIPRGFFVSWSK